MSDRGGQDVVDGPVAVHLSAWSPPERQALIAAYEREVYAPAFPDAEIREDPAYWLRLLDEQPGSPDPLIEVVLLCDGGGAIVGGVTIEFYRRAGCGLLTYISVAADRRGGGLGRRLMAEARAALTRMARRVVPMLAETERHDDARTTAERDATVLRHKRLARLGARMIDLDYVMPPLRPGLPPHRLHLLLFGDDPTIATTTVRALIAELADALGADLSASADLRAMMAALDTNADSGADLATAPLPATRFNRRFQEAPVFGDIARASFSFAFECHFERGPGVPAPPAAFRLERMLDLLEAPDRAAVHAALVEPARSFLDDVTTGPPGRNGRPLLFRASATPAESDDRQVTMIRPERWHYPAEGRVVELLTGTASRRIPLRIEDSFCAFESGRLFYVLTLVLGVEEAAGSDEYAVLQLQQLALQPDDYADNVAFLAFAPGEDSATGSLVALAEQRLAALERAAAPRPNGVADIVRAFAFQRGDETRRALAPCDLRSLCVGIEHPRLLRVAKRVADLFDELGERTDGDDPPSLHRCDPAESSRPDGPPRHRDEKSGFDPELLAFAGLAQGVPDFLFQDESEVHDSTRPTSRSVEAALYAHPRFVLEVGTNWRSFDEGRKDVGTCPYLLLMWLVAIQDELIVTEIEASIDRLVYDPASPGTRAIPLAEVDAVLRHVQHGRIGRGIAALKANLEQRFDLFRWLSINRSANLFRYPREKQALEAIQAAMGTAGRFERAEGFIDRTENLVEDVSQLQRSYADRRTNLLLLLLALIGLLGVPKTLDDLAKLDGFGGITAAAAITVLVLLAGAIGGWFVRNWWLGRAPIGQDRRRSKSS